jgi:putative acetyltransferase
MTRRVPPSGAHDGTMSTRAPAGVLVRSEAPGDAAAIRELTDAAFAPSTDEGRIVDALRQDAAAWVPDLSLVAVDVADGRLVGHVVTSLGTLHGADAPSRPVLALGPISVLPERQGQGIGAALIHETVARATSAGWPVIVLLGHATYYPRFGFEPARALGIEPQQPWSDEHWMALRLPGWTTGLHGTMRYPSAFGID